MAIEFKKLLATNSLTSQRITKTIIKGIKFLLTLSNCFNLREQTDRQIKISKNQPAETKFSMRRMRMRAEVFREKRG